MAINGHQRFAQIGKLAVFAQELAFLAGDGVEIRINAV